MIRLGVNLDHIATIRNSRGESYPSPAQAAIFAEMGGAANITCHLREDRRHIRDRDLEILREIIQVPLNFEMAITPEMLAIAKRLKPHAVTLVPEKRQELTTEGGLNPNSYHNLRDAVSSLRIDNILVSLFVEADKKVVDTCKELGADAIEIHTGDFCQQLAGAKTTQEQWKILQPFIDIARHGHAIGLQVHFGHGLNYNNAHWLQAIPHCEEANIGHAIVARSVFVGLTQAVQEMHDLLNNPKFVPVLKA